MIKFKRTETTGSSKRATTIHRNVVIHKKRPVSRTANGKRRDGNEWWGGKSSREQRRRRSGRGRAAVPGNQGRALHPAEPKPHHNALQNVRRGEQIPGLSHGHEHAAAHDAHIAVDLFDAPPGSGASTALAILPPASSTLEQVLELASHLGAPAEHALRELLARRLRQSVPLDRLLSHVHRVVHVGLRVQAYRRLLQWFPARSSLFRHSVSCSVRLSACQLLDVQPSHEEATALQQCSYLRCASFQ